ncbi:Crp/Fnr family transcriptional regulator [Anoxybacterium hadale]|uniref:Crp/Fnr family transcriptional regulator n=1 Tax=Anoxybacterium hadale TaxID=3408580 RepID=UPI003B00CE11
MENIACLSKSRLFQGIERKELEDVCRFVVPSEGKFLKNQIIVNQGEVLSRVGILKKGTAFNTKYHFNGNEQILRIYRQGEVLSLDAVSTTLSTSPVTIVSQSDSSVLFLTYKRIFETPEIDCSLKERILFNSSEILGNELIRLMYKIDVLSKRTLQERILTYLSLIREKNNSDTFEIDMNQEQLAQYLCVNRSALSKELNLMRRKGMIHYRGKRYTLIQAIR